MARRVHALCLLGLHRQLRGGLFASSIWGLTLTKACKCRNLYAPPSRPILRAHATGSLRFFGGLDLLPDMTNCSASSRQFSAVFGDRSFKAEL